MMRADFVRKLAMRMLAGEGIMGIWELQVAAANAHRRGQSAVAVMLTEIVDAAEQEWRLAARLPPSCVDRRRSLLPIDSGRSGWAAGTGLHAPKQAPRAPLDSASPNKSKHGYESSVGRCWGPWLSSFRSCFAVIRSAVSKPSVKRPAEGRRWRRRVGLDPAAGERGSWRRAVPRTRRPARGPSPLPDQSKPPPPEPLDSSLA